MAETEVLRWGILGTAKINQALINPIRSSKYSTLIGVASRSREKAFDYAKKWGIPQFYASYEELIKDPNIDVIYNSLPNSLHAEWSIKAMLYGKHVLCEKPLTTDVNDVDRLIKIAKETDRIIAEAFMYRHHPLTFFVKKLVDEGKIGKLQLIRGSFCYTNIQTSDVQFDPSLGGGSLWDVGCYPINYARYIIGKEPIEVYGFQTVEKSGVDVLFIGQLLFPGQVICQFDCSFTSPYKASVEITGDKGRISIPNPYKPGINEKLYLDMDKKYQTIKVKGIDLYSGEVADLENSINTKKPPRISLQDSRGNIAVIEALYKSAQLSKPIKLLVRNQ